MASPEMLVAGSQRLGGLRTRVMGSYSGTLYHDNDGLPHGPNATKARADHICALGDHSNDFTPLHNTCSQNTCHGVDDIQEGVWWTMWVIYVPNARLKT